MSFRRRARWTTSVDGRLVAPMCCLASVDPDDLRPLSAHRQYDRRRVLRIVQHLLLSGDEPRGPPETIARSGIAREARVRAAGQLHAKPVVNDEAMRGGPHLDLDAEASVRRGVGTSRGYAS